MAEIFLAALHGDEGFEKRVVLKRILPQFSSDPPFVQMFVDEAVLAARIAHSNVVQVYDFGNVDGMYFIAMEWVDGVDLRRLLAADGSRLTAVEVAAIGEGVARGLAHAHNLADDDGAPLHIVHRDVSPHNIMISRAGEAKVMDFGIAKAAARAGKTATGAIKGKVAYMSPEQGSAKPVDKRTDQFALGVVLWECLSGQRLFAGDSELEVLGKVVRCEVRDVRALAPATPDRLADVTMRCLARDPDDRHADLGEVAAALAGFRFSIGTAGVVHLGRLVDQAAPRAQNGGNRRTQQYSLPEPPHGVGVGGGWTGSGSSADSMVAGVVARPHANRSGVDVTPSQSVSSQSIPGPDRPRRRWLWAGVAAAVLTTSAAVVATWNRLATAHGVDGAAARMEVTSVPAGARIRLDGRDTGLTTPAVLPGRARGQPVHVEVTLDGYEDWESRITPSAAVERVSATLQRAALPPGESLSGTGLALRGTAAAARTFQGETETNGSQGETETNGSQGETETNGSQGETEAPRNIDASTRQREQQDGRKQGRNKERRIGRRKETPAAPRASGQLSLRSTGAWAHVYHNGKTLGTTPLTAVAVPAGQLRLRLVNRGAGIDREIVVNVPPGVEVRRTVTME
jgi:serine/threonine-protein kinase